MDFMISNLTRRPSLPARPPPFLDRVPLAIWGVLGPASVQASSLIMMVLSAAILGVSDYGTYALALIFIEIVILLTHTGFVQYIVAGPVMKDAEHALSTIFWIVFGLGAFGALALIWLAPKLAKAFETPQLSVILIFLALLQPGTAALGWANAVLLRNDQSTAYFAIQAATNTAALAVGVLTLVLWPSLFALVLYRTVRVLLGLGLSFLAIQHKPTRQFNLSTARKAITFSSGLYGGKCSQFGAQFSGDLILAYVFSTTESGLYRFANRLATAALDLVGHPLRTLTLARLGQIKRAGLPVIPAFSSLLIQVWTIVGATAVIAGTLGPDLIRLIFPAEFAAALPIFLIFLIRGAGATATGLIDPFFGTLDNTKVSFWHHTYLGLLGVVAALYLAPLGMVPLAVGQAAVAWIGSVLAMVWFVKYGGLHLNDCLGKLSGWCILFAAASAVSWAFQSHIQQAMQSPSIRISALTAATGIMGWLVFWAAKRLSLLPHAIIQR